jgi:hypothetical protein
VIHPDFTRGDDNGKPSQTVANNAQKLRYFAEVELRKTVVNRTKKTEGSADCLNLHRPQSRRSTRFEAPLWAWLNVHGNWDGIA